MFDGGGVRHHPGQLSVVFGIEQWHGAAHRIARVYEAHQNKATKHNLRASSPGQDHLQVAADGPKHLATTEYVNSYRRAGED
jgi:hypothetical protein